MSTKTPEYKVLEEDGNIQIRSYPSYITAFVVLPQTNYKDAANEGFRILANYIFGNNISKKKTEMKTPVSVQHSEKIEMTTPVLVEGEKEYKISFIMPSRYTIETLPEPLNKDIKFDQKNFGKFATIRFTGFFSNKNIDKNIKKLNLWIEEKGIQKYGDYIIAGYNGPYTPWFLSRNEILIRI